MWPGQQPPGGEHDARNQNPYQQPGHQQPGFGPPGPQGPYQQPNPYQQPGQPPQPNPYQQDPNHQPDAYPQPNAYQQPTVPLPGGPTPHAEPPGPGSGKRRTTLIAVCCAVAVVAALSVSGYLVVNKKDAAPNVDADGRRTAHPAPPAPVSSPADNPRSGGTAKPTIAGWKVVSNPAHATEFDVPPGWNVESSGMYQGFDDVKKSDGSALAVFSAPAELQPKWCEEKSASGGTDDTALAAVGTKGDKGAKSTASAAVAEAGTWAFAAYGQHEPEKTVHQKIKVGKAVTYTTASGLKGSYASATTNGLTKHSRCDTDGKTLAFTFINGKGDYTTWVLYGARGVGGEVPEKTMMRIMSTVRVPADSVE